MKLHAEGAAARITSYGPGFFAFGDRVAHGSILVRGDGSAVAWPPASVHDLEEAHMRQIIDLRPEVALLGTGVRQSFPPGILLRPFAEARLSLEVMDTAAACRTYNVLAAEGREVVAALIPVG